MNDTTFTAEQMGHDWPFRDITSGTVACEDGLYAVFHANNGLTYALNGTAKTAARTGQKTYHSIDPIWRDNPRLPGTKVSIAPLLSKAVSLCK